MKKVDQILCLENRVAELELKSTAQISLIQHYQAEHKKNQTDLEGKDVKFADIVLRLKRRQDHVINLIGRLKNAEQKLGGFEQALKLSQGQVKELKEFRDTHAWMLGRVNSELQAANKELATLKGLKEKFNNVPPGDLMRPGLLGAAKPFKVLLVTSGKMYGKTQAMLNRLADMLVQKGGDVRVQIDDMEKVHGQECYYAGFDECAAQPQEPTEGFVVLQQKYKELIVKSESLAAELTRYKTVCKAQETTLNRLRMIRDELIEKCNKLSGLF